MNTTLIWMIVFITILSFAVYALLSKKSKLDFDEVLGISLVTFFIGVTIVCGGFYLATGYATSDVEIINGKVTNKSRVHDQHEESYQCNCTTSTDSNGNQSSSCQTCWETHYTVEWTCNTTVGDIQVDKKDSTRESVYNTPDPIEYARIVLGEPAASRHKYTNYIQAVPESLFKSVSSADKQKFASLIPTYPDNVYALYKINRFFSEGVNVPDAQAWNNDIGNMLRELGPQKQVNLIVVIAKTDDSNYEYALSDAWEGANKNDVVLLIGSSQYPKIDFVRVISWTKNELFKIELRDDIMFQQNINREKIMSTVQAQILKNFERRHMREFEYLKNEIDPPTWVIVLSLIFCLLVPVGLTLSFMYTGIRGYKRKIW
jgi:hypothetical protein